MQIDVSLLLKKTQSLYEHYENFFLRKLFADLLELIYFVLLLEDFLIAATLGMVHL